MINSHITLLTVSIPIYSVMTYLGIVVAYIVAINRIEKCGVPFPHFLILCASALTGMLVGSRLLHFMTAIHTILPDFTLKKVLILLGSGGFVFYGGLYGSLLGLVVAARILRIETNAVIDVFIFSFPTFHFFGRIGCFFAGCCYGIINGYGVRFSSDPDNLRLPTQLYECVLNAFLIIILMIFEKKMKWNLLSAYLSIYAVARFFLEFLRGDDIRGAFLIFTTSQWISIFTLLAILQHYIAKCVEKRTRSKNLNTV